MYVLPLSYGFHQHPVEQAQPWNMPRGEYETTRAFLIAAKLK